MKILKKNKYSILQKVLKYSFIMVFAVSLIFPIVFVNKTTGATEHWGYKAKDSADTPFISCGFQDGSTYQIGNQILNAETACNAQLKTKITGNPPSCKKYTDTCPQTMILAPYNTFVPAGGDSNTPAGGDSNTPPPTSTTGTTIDNPLKDSLNDIPSFIEEILNIVLVVGVPLVALAIIYSGFLFVQAQGNAEALGKAKKALIYTLVGAVLLLGAWVLAEAIQKTVDDIKKTA
jgi:hypothetical protein